MADPKPVRILAQRCGGISDTLKHQMQRHRAQMKALRAALADGPKTVADIAEALGVDPREALWVLMALRKYGDVVTADQQGDRYLYTLKK